MALKLYQKPILPGVLYEIFPYFNPAFAGGGTEQVAPNIEVIGGTVDIYGSQVQPGSAPTGMFKTATGFSGIDVFAAVPNYLYIQQATGTTTSITLSGVDARPV